MLHVMMHNPYLLTVYVFSDQPTLSFKSDPYPTYTYMADATPPLDKAWNWSENIVSCLAACLSVDHICAVL